MPEPTKLILKLRQVGLMYRNSRPCLSQTNIRCTSIILVAHPGKISDCPVKKAGHLNEKQIKT